MRGKRVLLTQCVVMFCALILYSCVAISFFYVLSFSSPSLSKPTRTLAITAVTFLASLVLMSNAYTGFEIGRKVRRSVFANVVLAVSFTDLFSYVMLEIMNTNPNNPEANPSIMLWGEDLLLLLIAIAVQIVLIFTIVYLADWLYNLINPPKDCLIIAPSQESAQHVADKMSMYPQKYNLTEVIHYTCPDIKETIRKHRVVFLADIPETEEVELEQYCYKHGREFYLLAEFEDVITSTAKQFVMDDTPFLHMCHKEPTILQRIVKRTADIIISASCILLLSPVLIITSIILKASGNGSVIFKQQRATRDGEIFKIYKFRTMYTGVANISASVDDNRVTPVGRFLRKYRIDELPQLFNVLKGEMSLVGPRPEMIENVDRYTREVPEFRYRQRMKAGLTGLAQIEGKYNTTPKDKAMLDLLYIEDFSLMYDLKLLLRTLTVFFRHNSTEGFGARHIDCPEIRTQAK